MKTFHNKLATVVSSFSGSHFSDWKNAFVWFRFGFLSNLVSMFDLLLSTGRIQRPADSHRCFPIVANRNNKKCPVWVAELRFTGRS